ncbi:MAG TPA: glycosyltransferase family 4 protein [Thermoflexia bacterium]|jgi:phosphatidylinositol alpha-1,6-mannosyltransferase|nr:glycosyltransferase family 4 protein [Thermoflexia bacterium]
MDHLLITHTFPPRVGGRESYLFHLFSRLDPSRVTVVTPDREGEWETFDRSAPFRMVRVPPEGLYWFFRGGRKLRLRWVLSLAGLCLRHRVGLVHCAVALPDGMTGLLLKRTLGLPYVQYVFGLEIARPALEPWTRERIGWVLREADRVVAISRATADLAVRLGAHPDRIALVPPGVDVVAYHPDPAAGAAVRRQYGLDGRRVILTLGRLVARKGQDMVIRALPGVLESVPEAVYLIAGSGPDRERLERLAWEVGVADRVIFAGRVPDEEVVAYYNGADVVAMPSREEPETGDVEGFGMVFLEANACGKPVVGGRSGGVVDAVADGVTGFLVDPHDPADLAARLVTLLRDPDLARRMGEAGRERAQREFTWDRSAQRLRAVVGDLDTAATGGVGRVLRSLPQAWSVLVAPGDRRVWGRKQGGECGA